MKALIKGIQWRRLSIRAIWLVLALILLGVAAIIHWQQAMALKKAQQTYSAQLNTNRTASDALDELNAYLEYYEAWYNQGLIGESPRLTWLETLKAISARYKIPRIEFELQSSHVAEMIDSGYFRDTVAMSQTPMTLNMRLAHEGDFINLLSDLRREAKGLFDIKECVFNHFPKTNRLNREISLQASCEITWYTLADAKQGWVDSAQSSNPDEHPQ